MSFSGTPYGENSLRERLGAHIGYLASHQLEGRLTGSEGGRLASEYIRGEFEALGLTPFGGGESYFHPFGRGTTRNVVGCIEGEVAETYIIMGAHFDHLGLNRKGEVYCGADDNASGVAALIECARLVAESDYKPRYTLVFIAFDAEEKGLIGSTKFAKTLPAGSIRAMINMDMVGWLKEGALSVEGTGTLAGSRELILALAERYALPIKPKRFENTPLVATDTDGFAKSGAPTLSLTTGLHEVYHRTSDTPDKIDLPGVELITRFAADLVREVDSNETLVATGKVARKHRACVNSLELSALYGFGNSRLYHPTRKVEGEQMGSWMLGLSAQYTFRHLALRGGLQMERRRAAFITSAPEPATRTQTPILHSDALTLPFDLIIKSEGAYSYSVSVGGYWAYNLTAASTDLPAEGFVTPTPAPHEWGVRWSFATRLGSLTVEATNSYSLTPAYSNSSSGALLRTTYCTFGWVF